MSLRFKRSIDVAPHMFANRVHADTDLLLYSGAWQVGRLQETHRSTEPRVVFVWSLPGPHTPEAPVTLHGEATSLKDAMQQIVDAMRAWTIWAGLRTADGSAPPEPRWLLTAEHLGRDHPMMTATCDATTDWLMISGGFAAGRVFRPVAGPRHDPHWMLFTSGPMRMRGTSAGWADSVEEAKANLLRAWHAWLEWAELQQPS